MPSYRTRETRQAVAIGARLRKEAGWSDAVIRNVTTRGLMAACSTPPARGEFVELRCGSQVIVAQVVWTRRGRFGARVRDRLDLAALIPGMRPRAPHRPERPLPARFQVIKPMRRSLAERAETSRRQARMFDFVAVSLAGAVFALLVASMAYEALARPFGQITTAFSAN